MGYEILEHPADIGFRVRAATEPELFASAAEALVSLILDVSAARPVESVTITAEAADRESLMVNWLNEVLYFTDGRRLAFAEFEISSLTETRIDCIARGEPRDPERHPPLLCVKAVTYHQLRVIREPDGWCAEVYVDI
jgi:protein archease